MLVKIYVLTWFLQEATQQDLEAGFLKKPPLLHSTSSGKTATLQLVVHPLFLKEAATTTHSRILFHRMHLLSHKQQPTQLQLQLPQLLQQQLLQQQPLPLQRLLLPFRINNKWVSDKSTHGVNFL